MATLGAKLTLLDVSKNKDSKIGKVAEVLVEENPMLEDLPYFEMNEGTIHKEEIRSGLPTVYYRKANQPIPSSKTTTEERSYSAAHFESKSQIDEMVAKRGGMDRIGYNRWNQAEGHLQAMGLEHADLIIYGSPASDHRKVAGLADIYSTLSTGVESSKQIVNAGGAQSDNTSMYLINWGERALFGVYPSGTEVGIKRTDRSKGDTRVQIQGTDENGNPGHYWGYEEQFEIDHGLVVKDYRQASRLCNIDISNLQTGAGAADLLDLMISMYYKIHNPKNGVGVYYCNRTIEAFLHKQARTVVGAGAGLTFENVDGKKVLSFLGMPVKRSDALLNTEATVS